MGFFFLLVIWAATLLVKFVMTAYERRGPRTTSERTRFRGAEYRTISAEIGQPVRSSTERPSEDIEAIEGELGDEDYEKSGMVSVLTSFSLSPVNSRLTVIIKQYSFHV